MLFMKPVKCIFNGISQCNETDDSEKIIDEKRDKINPEKTFSTDNRIIFLLRKNMLEDEHCCPHNK